MININVWTRLIIKLFFTRVCFRTIFKSVSLQPKFLVEKK